VGERGKILIKSGLVNPICNQIMWNKGAIFWFDTNVSYRRFDKENRVN